MPAVLRLALFATLAAATWSSQAATPSAFPERPVRFIVTFPPGALNDLIARTLSPQLTALWGRQVVVDNRPGGGTLIGTEMGARAAPDGHTLLLAAAAHAINPSVYPKLPYDPVKDFAPVSLLASSPYILIVHPAVAAKTFKEFIALAKAKPGQLAYGTTGSGGTSHLMGVMLNMMAGTDTVHVPYKGLAPALIDLVAGQIHYSFGSYSTVSPHLKSGRLRPLAVTSLKRAKSTPELPTIAEQGYPGYEAIPWWGVMVPVATPKPLVARLNADLLKVLQSPEVTERFAAQGLETVGSTPAEFARFLDVEIARWAKVVKAGNVRVD